MDRLLGEFAVFWTRVLRYPWSRLRRATIERGNREVGLPTVGTLDDVAAALREVEWTPDGRWHLYDAVSLPGTVWKTKRDDCDGFAVLAATLLKQLDPANEPLLLTAIILPLKKAHTVCAFRDGGALRFFDNARLRDETLSSYEEVARLVATHGEVPLFWDLVTPDTLRVVESARF